MNITNYIDFFEILDDTEAFSFNPTQIIEADWEIIENEEDQ